ncbi:kinase-like domain-containing protein [Circinella umbellata]|nr:kinase-like domain-containing protein [Circinella umbellata]
MTTVYSIQKSVTTTAMVTTTGGGVSVGGNNYGSLSRRQNKQQKYSSKPHTIQSGGMLTSYTALPPSPPHKHKQQTPQQNSMRASSLDSTLSTNSRDVIVGDQWIVLSRIGEGSFGEVFEVQDIDTHCRYAIKREPLDVHSPQLKHESIMYDILTGGRGIPQCQWYGEHDDFACIVIDLLGPSLRELYEAVSFISLDIVVQLGCQMIYILEDTHNRGIVYRDVKPDNFLFPSEFHLPEYAEIYDHMVSGNISHSPKPSCQDIFETWGLNKSSSFSSSPSPLSFEAPKLSVVDFGLATWWRNPATNKPYSQSKRRIKNKTGTARYASLNVHRGKTHSRRDDIESLGYLLLELTLGSLPWTGIQARNSKAGWDRMKELKEETVLSDLCTGLPRGFLQFIEYARGLRFSDQPDYDYLRQLMRDSLDHNSEMSQLEGVFMMDDLVQELPIVSGHQEEQQQHQQQQQRGGGSGRRRRNSSRKLTISKGSNNHHGHNNNNNASGGRQQQQHTHHNPHYHNHNHHDSPPRRNNGNKSNTPPSPPAAPSFQKFIENQTNNNRRKRSVGWNTHKHDNNNKYHQHYHHHYHHHHPPDQNIHVKEPSWGEDKHGAPWGHYY